MMQNNQKPSDIAKLIEEIKHHIEHDRQELMHDEPKHRAIQEKLKRAEAEVAKLKAEAEHEEFEIQKIKADLLHSQQEFTKMIHEMQQAGLKKAA